MPRTKESAVSNAINGLPTRCRTRVWLRSPNRRFQTGRWKPTLLVATARFFAAHLSNHDRDRDPGCGRCRGNRIHLMTEHVIVTDADGIRTIRMNRPDKKNALTLAMYEAMTAALEGANADDSIHCVPEGDALTPTFEVGGRQYPDTAILRNALPGPAFRAPALSIPAGLKRDGLPVGLAHGTAG